MNRSALLMLPALLSAVPAQACTLWASVTPGGVLLAKNRDWAPDHVQSLRLLRPTGGLAYLGLFADSGRMPGIKAGVNEAGQPVACRVRCAMISRAGRGGSRRFCGSLARWRTLLMPLPRCSDRRGPVST